VEASSLGWYVVLGLVFRVDGGGQGVDGQGLEGGGGGGAGASSAVVVVRLHLVRGGGLCGGLW